MSCTLDANCDLEQGEKIIVQMGVIFTELWQLQAKSLLKRHISRKNRHPIFSLYFTALIYCYDSQNFKNIFLITFKAGHRTDFGLKVSKMFYGPFWLRVVPFQRHFRRFYTDFTQKIPFFKKKFLPQKLLFTQKIKKRFYVSL